MYPRKWCIHTYFSTFFFVRLVVGILLNERKGFCRARFDRALEGLGVAGITLVQTSTTNGIRYATYLIVPDAGSSLGVISTPFSTTFEISNTASDIAADIQTDASAR